MDKFLANSFAQSPQLVQVCQMLELSDLFTLSTLCHDARKALQNYHIKLYDPRRDDPFGAGDPSLESGSQVVRSARNSRDVQDKRQLSAQPRVPSIWIPTSAFQPLDNKILRMQETIADSKKYGETESVLQSQIERLNNYLERKTAQLESNNNSEQKSQVDSLPTSHWILAGANLTVDSDESNLDVFRSYDPRGLPNTLRHMRLRLCDKLLTFQGIEVFQRLEDFACNSAAKIRNLDALGNCTNLSTVNVKGFDKLASLAGLSNATALRCVRLDSCPKLVNIDGLGMCIKLRSLTIVKCPIPTLFGLGSCKSLTHLHVELCNKLGDITALSSVTSLEHLTLKECPLVNKIPDLSQCKFLVDLDLSACRHLTDLSGLYECGDFIQHLVLDDCAHLQNLEVLTFLDKLVTFRASRCRRLQRTVESLESSSSNIRKFKLTVCTAIKDATPLGACEFLTHLNLSWNSQLREISGLEKCVNLRYANFTHCQSLEDLTGIGGCINLKFLNLRYCDNLPDLLDIETCTSLQTLDCSCCHTLTDVSYLETCLNLQTVDFSVCKYLKDISVLEKLPKLETLYVYKSKRLSTDALVAMNTGLTVYTDRQYRERHVHRNREMLADLEQSSDEEDEDMEDDDDYESDV